VNVNDLTSLLWILKTSRQSGIVLLELRDVKGTSTGEPWQAYLYLVEGRAVACRIYSKKDGRVLLGNEEAMHWLARWEKREFAWKALTSEQSRAILFAQQSSSPQGLLPSPQRAASAQRLNEVMAANNDGVPQRLVSVEKNIMRSWPRNHRLIFALVDGKRSVEKIAAMLKLTQKNVEEVLSDLHRIGVIRRVRKQEL